MPIDLDRNLIFIHIPRTGGTSIEHLFDLTHLSKSFGMPEQLTADTKTMQHLTWLELRALLRESIFDRAYKFAFVRNPWDRFLSEFLWRRSQYLGRLRQIGTRYYEKKCFDERHIVSLDAFVRVLELPVDKRVGVLTGFDGHLETQLSFISNEERHVTVDFVGRFEHFEHDVNVIASRVGLEIDDVISLNVTERHRDYRQYFSTHARDAVMSFYGEDITEFGYSF